MPNSRLQPTREVPRVAERGREAARNPKLEDRTLMPQRRRLQKPLDRAAEYIDSPLMTQRTQYKQGLSARIDGY